MPQPANSSPSPAAAAFAAWQHKVTKLTDDIKSWARQEQWPVREQQQVVSGDGVPPYPVTILRLELPEGEVILEPVSMNVPGWHGRIDLYAWPSLNRVRLLASNGDAAEWVVYTESNVKYGKPWSRDTFIELARELAAST
jgi:hypothetical protein